MDVFRYEADYGERARIAFSEIALSDTLSEKQWEADTAAFHCILGAALFIPAVLYMIGFIILLPLSVYWGIKAIQKNTRFVVAAYTGMCVAMWFMVIICCHLCSVC
ncbi:hypothetical protein SAMN06296386_105197 [Lachnospiraceae bacterium]|nr:hypothetical protein SAMN06296386_105197 [Lachnospiraceae bacterium]